jgi:hypothetical protein
VATVIDVKTASKQFRNSPIQTQRPGTCDIPDPVAVRSKKKGTAKAVYRVERSLPTASVRYRKI